MKTLDYLADAVQRGLRGEDFMWTWFRVMDSDARLKFDGFLVQTDDPLAYQAGSPESRFRQKVEHMVKLEHERQSRVGLGGAGYSETNSS